MAEELKVPSLEERLANVLAHRGQVRFNRQTVSEGLPSGDIGYTDMASADNLRRYADCIGDFNSRFRDPEYAKVTKYGSIIGQPTWLASAAHHVDPAVMKK